RRLGSWQTQKILNRPKSFIPNGSLSIKLRFWSLTAKSYESELQQQKPLSSIVFRLYRIAQTPMLNGRPSKMLWRASAFSSGTILGFLIGKRSENSRGNVVKQSADFADQNRRVLRLRD